MKKLFSAVSLLLCVVCSSAFAQTPAKPAQDQSWKPPVSTLTRATASNAL